MTELSFLGDLNQSLSGCKNLGNVD